MPFPSGVLPTNRNMPWNSSWKIHLIPARLFFRPSRSFSHQYESESEGFFPLYPLLRAPAVWWISAITFWMMFAFHFYSSSLFLGSVSYLSSAVLGLFWAVKKESWNHPWKCAVLGSLICIWYHLKRLYYTGPLSAVNQISRSSDIHDFTGHWRIFQTCFWYCMPIS